MADRKRLIRRWAVRLGVVAGCGLLVLGGVALRQRHVGQQAELDASLAVPPLLVRVAPARSADGYDVGRRFVGRVEPRRRAEAAFEVGGLVVGASAEDGEAVSAGQALARLDTARLDARLAEARAQRERAEAELRLARVTLGRIEDAAEVDAASDEELDEALRAAEVAEAGVRAAEAAARAVEVDLAKSTLFAPFDAVVARRHVDEGDVVAEGATAFELLEREGPEARVGLAGPAVEDVAAGQARSVRVNGRDVPATVRSVLPRRGDRSRTVEALLSLDTTLAAAGEPGVREGDMATLVVERRVGQPGYTLPLSALTEGTRGLWAAYVAEPVEDEGDGVTHRVARRDLELLHATETTAHVGGALGDGELVVVEGTHRLTPGLGVRVEVTEVAR